MIVIGTLEFFLLNKEQIFWEEKNNKKMVKKYLNLDWEYTRKQLKKLHKKRK